MKEKTYIKVSSIEEIYNNIRNFIEFQCERCGKVSTKQVRKDRPHSFDLICTKCHKELTCLEKYGVKSNFQVKGFTKRSIEKKIAKYGNACNLKKRYKTCQDKYGCNNYCETKNFKEQCKLTTIKNFGSIKESYKAREIKSRKTKKERYGIETYHNVESFKDTINKKREQFEIENDCINLHTLINKYGQGFKALNLEKIYDDSGNAFISTKYLDAIKKYASSNHNVKSISNLEIEIANYVKSICKDKIKTNVFGIIKDDNGSSLELDIYIPTKNIAIEFNGLYWHSTEYKDQYYHQKKTEYARNKNIHLIHIFEDDWNNNKDKCKQIINECINNTFINIIDNEEDVLIGDNNLPIFGNYEILKITEPQLHQIGRFSYYDSGKIFYKNKNV